MMLTNTGDIFNERKKSVKHALILCVWEACPYGGTHGIRWHGYNKSYLKSVEVILYSRIDLSAYYKSNLETSNKCLPRF